MPERVNIPLSETFKADSWVNYISFDAETKAHLTFQRHADIRTFMADSDESWTEGSFGFTTGMGNFPALTVKVPTGATEYTQSSAPMRPVDLLTEFGPNDLITFGLPGFSLETVNIKQSYIEITSSPEGNFSENAQLNALVRFNQSTKALKEGDSQWIAPRSLFEQNEIDLSKITAVRFALTSTTEEATIIIAGLRLILAPGAEPEAEPGWQTTTVDFDNWNGRLRKPSPLDGNFEDGPEFVMGSLFRSAPLSGPNDPMPIDAEMGVVFNTGSQKHTNGFTIYMREASEIFQTQLDLDGIIQGELDGRPQPDLGTKEFLPRTMEELDDHPMEQFDLQTMEELERIPASNPVEESWIYFQFQWGPTGATLTMGNSNEPTYIFPTTTFPHKFTSRANYLFVCSVEDNSARVRIYELEPNFAVNQVPVFDSTLIDDDSTFKRRKGRLGWAATLGDPDAYISSIRPRGVNFAEYESASLLSPTPVRGAQLFANFSGNLQLWDKGFNVIPASSNGVLVTKDKSKSITGESFKVKSNGTEAPVGLSTDLIEFTDFSQMEIKFSLWFSGSSRTVEKVEHKHPPTFPSPKLFPPFFPSKGYIDFSVLAANNIIAQLESEEGTIIPLVMPELETNEWHTIVLRIPTEEIIQTGLYRFQIIQPTLIAATWWVDQQVEIFQRSVQWSARSVASDPWKANFAPWTDFREILNIERQGILLSPRGKELQIRARARRQDALVHQPRVIPQYASLGRLVFPEEELKGLKEPTAKFKAKGAGPESFLFTDESAPGTGAIVFREWDFGDGERVTGNSTEVAHTYREHGTYFASLSIMDRNGQFAKFSLEFEL